MALTPAYTKAWVLNTPYGGTVTSLTNDASGVTALKGMGTVTSTFDVMKYYTGPLGTSGTDFLLEKAHSSAFFGSGADDWVSFDDGVTQKTIQQYVVLNGVTVSINGGAPISVQVYAMILNDGTVAISLPPTFVTAQSLTGSDVLVFNFTAATDINTTSSEIGISVVNLPAAPCFVRGTLIETDRGPVAIEDLRRGDLVETVDDGFQEIRWIGSSRLNEADFALNPKMRPIRIRAGALGRGLPLADVLVSPQHRVVVSSKLARKMFDVDETLVAAKQLLLIPGVDIATDVSEVEYFHFLFDRHQIVYAEGAPMESLYTGPEAIKSVSEAAREEIFKLFPELAMGLPDQLPDPARLIVAGRQARKFVARHVEKHLTLLR
ncbi:Hint domain-containing protein [Pseudogemmobacter blasticus]|nr:Hint domain-containing protein [Fuscovulum blasticum]